LLIGICRHCRQRTFNQLSAELGADRPDLASLIAKLGWIKTSRHRASQFTSGFSRRRSLGSRLRQLGTINATLIVGTER
jgi:hypothetical protein